MNSASNNATTVFSRFHAVAHAHPAATALLSDAECVSYGALYEQALRAAEAIDGWYLSTLGRRAGPGDTIGIGMDKSAALYVAMFGILATGAGYVPVDPALPRDIREHIVRTSGCRLIVSPQAAVAGVSGAAVLAPDALAAHGGGAARGTAAPAARPADARGAAGHAGTTAPVTAAASPAASGKAVFAAAGASAATLAAASRAARAIPTDLCYTIFTSGSTGRPKGVGVTHANLLNLVDWARAEFALAPGVHALQYSTINFDASVLDIFPALLSGATLCIPTQAQRLSEAGLAEFCTRHAVHHAFLPPSLLGALDAQRFPGIRTLLTGGEACSPRTVQAWAPGRRFYNLYGPTECTVLVTSKRLGGEEAPANIGAAIAGVRLHVLDEHLAPATRGELHVAGVAVAPGYVGASDDSIAATASKFIRVPALDASPLYKTGDIVERGERGELTFIGRADRQVKVRGYRIELEEIEGALLSLGVAEAAVQATPQGVLAAWVGAPQPIDTAALRQRLATVLSDYKIPQQIMWLERLPCKVSGKIDYQALPAIGAQPVRLLPDPSAPAAVTAEVTAALAPASMATQPAPETAPPDHRVHAIARLWARELELDPRQLGPHSHFRDLGGSSIHIVRLLANIEAEFGARIDFIDFLDNPTIAFINHSLNQHA